MNYMNISLYLGGVKLNLKYFWGAEMYRVSMLQPNFQGRKDMILVKEVNQCF